MVAVPWPPAPADATPDLAALAGTVSQSAARAERWVSEQPDAGTDDASVPAR